jgi:hypothetical protein
MILLALPAALANSSGIVGYASSGCTSCHGTSADTDVTGDLAAVDTVAAPGETLTLTFTLSSTDTNHEIGGFNVAASGGTLVVGSGTRLSGGELTHTRDQHFSGGRALWTFSWTAPTTEGSYTLTSSGLAGDHSHTEYGDGWDLDALILTVDDGCDDLDGDGYEACDDGSGADCDDGDTSIRPGASETCDGVDEDCDGVVDDHPTGGTPMYPDTDGDGYGDGSSPDTTCGSVADPGFSLDDQDCDDGDDTIHPDAEELCDGVDNNCDGSTDGADATGASSWWVDADGDGHGDPDAETLACDLPAGHADNADDCDDTRATVSPSATEQCDALDRDDDCDGVGDEAGADGESTWYLDADGDGYGGTTTALACDAPAGHSAYDGDCDDADTAWHPGAPEACDDPADYNCDGSTGYVDGDGDGWAACLDCDDGAAAVNAAATESCNGVDDDCDGVVDEADAAGAPAWYADADGDGFGTTTDVTLACTQPDGFASNAGDCDDADAGIRPDAPETWYDGVDQDCDGGDDDQDGDGFPLAEDCDDTTASVHPGATDTAYDGVDADCAGDSDFDADGDGHDSESWGGDDCDDADAATHPGAQDEPYDGVIYDCDDADEHDLDGDGHDLGEDCDDARSDVHPGAEEVWYDGLDQDCDGADDDRDGDGLTVAVDCDDEDPAVALCEDGDTGPEVDEDEEAPEGCGCDTGNDAPLAGLLAIAMVMRRRR